MKYIFVLISFFFFTFGLHAQYSYAKAEEFSIIQNRPLIVEQLELDEKLIEFWEKKISKGKNEAEYTENIEKYKSFVIDYNTFIKKAIEDHWGFNSEVIYKTTSEVTQLMKDDSEAYTVLWYSETDSKKKNEYGFTYFPDLTVPTLNYSRIENGRFKTDYCYFPHYSHDRNDKLEYTDLVLSLKLMKQHMDYIVANDEKKYTFREYAIDQASENCKDLPSQTLFIQDAAIHEKAELSEMNAGFSGQVETLTDQEICQAIEEDEDRIVGLFFPYGIVVGSIGPASKGRVQYVRCFVNIKTGKIFTAQGGKMGQMFDAYFREGEFENYSDCK